MLREPGDVRQREAHRLVPPRRDESKCVLCQNCVTCAPETVVKSITYGVADELCQTSECRRITYGRLVEVVCATRRYPQPVALRRRRQASLSRGRHLPTRENEKRVRSEFLCLSAADHYRAGRNRYGPRRAIKAIESSVASRNNDSGARYEPVWSKPIAISNGATAPANVKIANIDP